MQEMAGDDTRAENDNDNVDNDEAAAGAGSEEGKDGSGGYLMKEANMFVNQVATYMKESATGEFDDLITEIKLLRREGSHELADKLDKVLRQKRIEKLEAHRQKVLSLTNQSVSGVMKMAEKTKHVAKEASKHASALRAKAERMKSPSSQAKEDTEVDGTDQKSSKACTVM